MKATLIEIDQRNRAVYQINGDHDIYTMVLRVQMIKSVSPNFSESSVKEAKVASHILPTLYRYHFEVGKKVTVKELFRLSQIHPDATKKAFAQRRIPILENGKPYMFL